MKVRDILPPMLALLLGIVIGLALLEGLVRLGGHRRRVASTAIDTEYHSPWHRPDVREIPAPGAGPPFRIEVVGDSFTWGAGVLVEDTYPRRLERQLWREELPVRVEVHVTARPGWASTDEAHALAAEWPHLRPDLLIVGYVLNDPLPPPGPENDRLREPTRRRHPPDGLPQWLYRHSFLFDLVWDRIENTRQRHAFRDHSPALHEPQRPSWRGARQALTKMAALAAQRGITPVLVVFPVFDFESWDDYAYADIHRFVRNVAEERGYRVLDLLPAYRGVDGRRLALVPFTDAHPNEIAHRMAAERIARFLLDEGLVPRTLAETPAAARP